MTDYLAPITLHCNDLSLDYKPVVSKLGILVFDDSSSELVGGLGSAKDWHAVGNPNATQSQYKNSVHNNKGKKDFRFLLRAETVY